MTCKIYVYFSEKRPTNTFKRNTLTTSKHHTSQQQPTQTTLGSLDLGHITETTDAGASSRRSSSSGHPGATSNNLAAATTLPDTNSGALHRVLAAEGAGVLGVLADFNLLDLLAGSAAVAGAVLADDSDFFGALGL